jgi:hypothetical protein
VVRHETEGASAWGYGVLGCRNLFNAETR